ncbi:hypothetical protein, partial [Methanoregula sp.]|uniref:hypothetical protein n=1 Tax=Methanoregula sp. TaxID=2052170 RepID=UPI000CABAFE2
MKSSAIFLSGLLVVLAVLFAGCTSGTEAPPATPVATTATPIPTTLTATATPTPTSPADAPID